MKRIKFIFAALVVTAGIAVISCTKESATSTSQPSTSATDAVQVDNSVTVISDMIDDYQSLNTASFTDPTLKAAGANVPMSSMGMGRESCATVSMVKTPVLTGTAVTGATIKFTIDFGTAGCISKDSLTRTGTIVSTYTWVKAGGWSRVSTIDLYVNAIHYVGTQTTTFGVTGVNSHALFTENTELNVTVKDSLVKTWKSNRERELIEGNGGLNVAKIYKITGSSTFSNSKGASSSYTITVPLIKPVLCKIPTSGTIVTVNRAGVTTTIDYGTGTNCKDGYTVKSPGDKNGKGIFSRFIKWAR